MSATFAVSGQEGSRGMLEGRQTSCGYDDGLLHKTSHL